MGAMAMMAMFGDSFEPVRAKTAPGRERSRSRTRASTGRPGSNQLNRSRAQRKVLQENHQNRKRLEGVKSFFETERKNALSAPEKAHLPLRRACATAQPRRRSKVASHGRRAGQTKMAKEGKHGHGSTW